MLEWTIEHLRPLPAWGYAVIALGLSLVPLGSLLVMGLDAFASHRWRRLVSIVVILYAALSFTNAAACAVFCLAWDAVQSLDGYYWKRAEGIACVLFLFSVIAGSMLLATIFPWLDRPLGRSRR
jgi:hypothetical protein